MMKSKYDNKNQNECRNSFIAKTDLKYSFMKNLENNVNDIVQNFVN